ESHPLGDESFEKAAHLGPTSPREYADPNRARRINNKTRRLALHAYGPGRDRLEQVVLANSLLHSASAVQPHAALFQAAAHPEHDRAGAVIIGMGRVPGTPRLSFAALPAALRKAVLPGEQPRAAAGNVLQNLTGPQALEGQPDGFAAPGDFVSVFLVHTALQGGRMALGSVHDV